MKKFLLIAAILVGHIVTAQNWNVLSGTSGIGINEFFEDTANDRLLCYGGFQFVDDTTRAPGIAAWDGNSWSLLPGMPVLSANQSMGVNSLINYNGAFYMGCSVPPWGQGVPYFARYNGTTLDSIARFRISPPDWIVEYQGDLVMGTHWPNDSVNGMGFNGVVRWDGTTWTDMGQGAFTNLQHAAIVYTGELYVSDNARVKRYENGTWQTVGQPFAGIVRNLCEYNGELYAGCTNYQTSSANNTIMKLDTITDTWVMFGGGLNSSIIAGWSQIDGMVVSDGALFVLGYFDHAGGVLCPIVARWDGNTWCSLGVDLNTYQCRAIGTLRDTLYISSGLIFDNDSTNGWFVKWVGGNYTDTCGVTGIDNQLSPFNTFNVYPNPASDNVTFKTTGINDGVIRLYDGLGREVWNQLIIGSQTFLDASTYPPGLYFYRFEQNGKMIGSGKLILQ